MAVNKVLVITILHLALTPCSRTEVANHSIPAVKVVSGAYLTAMDHVILYNSDIPVPMEFQLPHLTSLSPPPSECTGLEFLCEISKKTYSAYVQMQKEIVKYHPYLHQEEIDSNVTTRGILDIIGKGMRYVYGVATVGDVNELHTTEVEMEKHVKALENSVAQQQSNFVSITRVLNSYGKGVRDELEKDLDILKTKINEGASTAQENEATLGYTQLHILQLLYTEHVMRIMDSVGDACRSRMIPRPVVTNEILKRRITVLSDTLRPRGWEAAVTSNQLLKMDIADCTFTESNFYVTIHVPIRRIGGEGTLYKVTSVPFHYEGSECVIEGATKYVAEIGGRTVPIDETMTSKCDVSRRNLCQVPSKGSNVNSFSSCAKQLMRGGTPEEIVKVCAFRCEKSAHKTITDLQDGSFGLTNIRNVTVACPNGVKRSYYTDKNVGALILKLPCECDGILDGETLEQSYVCPPLLSADQNEVIQIIPAGWSLIRSIVLEEAPGEYRNISDVLDVNWHARVPLLNVTPVSDLALRSWRTTVRSDFNEDRDIILVWLAILSTCLALLVIKDLYYFCKKSERKAGIAEILPLLSLIPKVAAADDSNPSFSVTLWALLKTVAWTEIILFLLILIAVVFIFVYLLRIVRFLRRIANWMEHNFDMEESQAKKFNP